MSSNARVTIDSGGLRRIATAASSLNERIANDVLADMLDIVPRDTGALADSLSVEKVDAKTYRVGSSDIDYAADVELGTSKMAAEPYMQPALFKTRTGE